MLCAGLLFFSAASVGATTGVVALNPPVAAPAAPLFSWVPSGGFPNGFPFGQCTWWVAFNRRVSWNGNAGDWLANASAQGIPIAATPSVGAIVAYRPGGPYSELGHVAVVIAVNSGSYQISEMNALGWGQVNTREVVWPDPHAAGFIPVLGENAP